MFLAWRRPWTRKCQQSAISMNFWFLSASRRLLAYLDGRWLAKSLLSLLGSTDALCIIFDSSRRSVVTYVPFLTSLWILIASKMTRPFLYVMVACLFREFAFKLVASSLWHVLLYWNSNNISYALASSFFCLARVLLPWGCVSLYYLLGRLFGSLTLLSVTRLDAWLRRVTHYC